MVSRTFFGVCIQTSTRQPFFSPVMLSLPLAGSSLSLQLAGRRLSLLLAGRQTWLGTISPIVQKRRPKKVRLRKLPALQTLLVLAGGRLGRYAGGS